MKNERDEITELLTQLFTYIMVSEGRPPFIDYPHPGRPTRVQFENATPVSIGFRVDGIDHDVCNDWNLIAGTLHPFASVRPITTTCLLLPLTSEEIAKIFGDAVAASEWDQGQKAKQEATEVKPSNFSTALEESRSKGEPDPVTKDDYLNREMDWLRREYPDNDDEIYRDIAKSKMQEDISSERWTPQAEKGKYNVGDTVDVGGELYNYRGQFKGDDGNVYAVVAGKGGQISVPVDKVNPGNLQIRPVGNVKDDHQKTWDEYRKERLQGYMSGGRTKPTPKELREMKEQHKSKILTARAFGKPVPAEVLADYPDLAGKATAPQPPEPGFTGRAANGVYFINGVAQKQQDQPTAGMPRPSAESGLGSGSMQRLAARRLLPFCRGSVGPGSAGSPTV